jgi:formylmethanofuran dehydrogenase subunit E
MLEGYQALSDDELLCAQRVRLTLPLEQVLSRPGVRATCAGCGEEIVNGRKRWRDDQPVCAGCAGESYHQPAVSPSAAPAIPPR